MTVVKYSKRPDRAPNGAKPGFLTDILVTLKPLFCASFLALALSSLAAGPTHAQSMAGGSLNKANNTQTTLDPIPPERGWQGLANVLEALRPDVDTRLTPSPSQITDHIERLINNGANQRALELIEQRQAQIKDQRGTDVQLMFQHGRVLAALDRNDEAIALYTEMTTRFPELPEPWNNLGVLLAARGDIAQAQEALQMALRAYPGYASAQANLQDLQSKTGLSASLAAPSTGNLPPVPRNPKP